MRPLSLCAAAMLLAAVPARADVGLSVFADGLNHPLFLTGAGNAVIVAQEDGTIVSIDRTTKVQTLLFTVPDISHGPENGLLGMALDPNYATNGRVFVNVTVDVGGTLHTEVRRYTDPAIATEAPSIIFRGGESTSTYHKGGWIGFGPDGNLYIPTGDGGPGYDPRDVAQSLDSLLGKVLRIDVTTPLASDNPGHNYLIPAGNPFGTEVFAYGLRNPYRDSFDSRTGDLYLGDVGESTYEEIDRIAAGTSGENFGWRALEGPIPTPGIGDPVPPGTTAPLYYYDHLQGDAAVIGGYVYRGTIASLYGRYVFGDYISGNLWSMNLDGTDRQSLSADLIPYLHPASFGTDADNNLYVVDLGGRIVELNGPAADPVPEPASWALMSVGFAVAGTAMRRRQRPQRVAA